jgi:hypothetical protein
VHGAPMVAEVESGAGLGGEWEGEVVVVAHPGVENEGLSVEAEDGVGAEEGVGERNRRRVEQSIEQVPGMERAAAGTVQEEETEAVVVVVVVEVAGSEKEHVELGDGGGKEWG